MKVVRLDDWRRSETAELGDWIVEHAAEIDGAATTIRMKDGTHKTFFTDHYNRHPHEAAGVALRLSMKLARAADQTVF